ncbi:uncharacterized protein LACBIDRAFT_307556 [Laccaria bicolor S238N-H82]|uniref:Predicted protein n=1 Tax=Laccaria bicolor (strain S238N-H82 / ATCC MYA-4686) TaxID=486041 RepID=B0DQE9_LACBS|nr:uncharacterized protein LACBIDRAFT_307556 [Laccaria bicolor S238N-H82]EDR03099.1 predicted protein [Laccaria bicolor S238N-H82]|eukprot:XP_001886240.1 predicted protein [Laccaria bicolor S238N-H82]
MAEAPNTPPTTEIDDSIFCVRCKEISSDRDFDGLGNSILISSLVAMGRFVSSAIF